MARGRGGIAAGVGVGLVIAGAAEALLGAAVVLPVVGVAAGLCLGGSQLLAGLSPVPSPIRWLAASAAGMALGFTLGTVLVEVVLIDTLGLPERAPASDLAALILVGALSGGGVGVGRRILGAGSRRGGAGWIVGPALGLALGAVAGGVLAYPLLDGIRSVGGMLLVALGAGAGIGWSFSSLETETDGPQVGERTG